MKSGKQSISEQTVSYQHVWTRVYSQLLCSKSKI